MKTKNLMMGCAVGALMAGTAAWAGLKTTNYVTVSLTDRYAVGTVGDARGSADTQQYIGCALQSDDVSNYVLCEAHDANGGVAFCYSEAPAMLTTASAQSGDSYFYFSWNENGICTFLYVTNSSNLAPRQP